MGRAQEAREQLQDPAAYEHKDAYATGLLGFLAGLFATVAIVMAVAAWVFVFFTTQRERELPFPLPKAAEVPPAPRLQGAPSLDIHQLRAEEDAVLETYGWADRSKGIVRLPIQRAMALLAQRGLPTRQNPEGPLTSPATGAPSGGPQTGPPVKRGAPLGQGAGSGGAGVGAGGATPPAPNQPPQRGRGPATKAPIGGGSRSSGPSH